MSNETATSTLDVMAVKTENIEYTVMVKLNDKQEVDTSDIIYRSNPEQVKKLTEEKGYTVAKIQTVTNYKVGSVQGLLDLIGDPDEVVNIINRGLQQKYAQKVAEYLTEFDSTQQKFVNEASEEVFDSKELLQEATQRRSLTQGEKIVRDLKKAGLTDAAIAAMLTALQASSGVSE